MSKTKTINGQRIRRAVSDHDLGVRARFEPHVPGGWWRRDMLLSILAAVYPRWMPASAFPPMVAHLRSDPREAFGWRRHTTVRALTRFHSYGYVDRYGEKGVLTGRVPGTDWKHGWRRGAGYRYRLRNPPAETAFL